ncbi:DUF2637 domain-containing protein [Catenulispora sp. NL8]|uniref:DUF2637 domain-containing protein n=1 Tax=Catenulispora pinistramenti TaxID=2705254 RepID=A0ABS5KHP4_9ACTN|nr:DUF2637 domain-containing protein [Catenulispora pinistramenti]MBS2545390.1 DUF2637 domain-containing protein [Catenulispora pinistramenti]
MSCVPDRDGHVAVPVSRYVAVAVLSAAVAGIVVVGFLGSYGPLRDAFLSIHQSQSAAARDPLAVDGLIAVAVASAIWLRHEAPARRYALTVAGVTTGASLLLNFLHGQGVIQPGGLVRQPLHPVLVFTIASLPVAAIGFGSHLLVACLRQFGPVRVQDPVPADGHVLTNDPYQDGLSEQDDRTLRPTTASHAPKAKPGRRPRPERDVLPPVTLRPGPDQDLVVRGRVALAALVADGVTPSRDALRARMGVGNGKASAVWSVLQDERANRPSDRTVVEKD